MPITFNVWLDDEPETRTCPPGFIHIGDIEEIKKMLIDDEIDQLSLDHDLGMCIMCTAGAEDGETVQCPHVATGYDLVLWMKKTGNWPQSKPIVHSQNPVGKERMERMIEESYGNRAEWESCTTVLCLCGVELRKFFTVNVVGDKDIMRTLPASMGWMPMELKNARGVRRSWNMCRVCSSAAVTSSVPPIRDGGYCMLLTCACGAELRSAGSEKPYENYASSAATFAASHGWLWLGHKRVNTKCYACLRLPESG